jgi:hypothetical protein
MKFSVLERIVLQGLLPAQGNYLTFKIIQDLKRELSFSEAEMKDYEISQTGEQIIWNKVAEQPKEIDIGEQAQKIIVESLKKLDEEYKIDVNTASLYEKFML